MSTIAKIEAFLNKEDLHIASGDRRTEIRRRSNCVARFTFDYTDLPHCCGMMEIGSLDTWSRTAYKKYEKYAVQYALLKEMRTQMDQKNTESGYQLPILVTNNVGASLVVEEALSELPKYFKKVSVHPGLHGRKLTLWVFKPFTRKELDEIIKEKYS